MRTSDTVMTAVSSMRSLSVLLSTIETSYEASLLTVIRNYSHSVHVLRILATATIQGQHSFCSELPIMRPEFKGSDYSRARLFEGASIRRNMVCLMVDNGT